MVSLAGGSIWFDVMGPGLKIWCIVGPKNSTDGGACHRRQSWRVRGRDPKILDRRGRGIAGDRGNRGRVVKYYFILSCAGSMFESGDF